MNTGTWHQMCEIGQTALNSPLHRIQRNNYKYNEHPREQGSDVVGLFTIYLSLHGTLGPHASKSHPSLQYASGVQIAEGTYPGASEA